MDKEKEQNTSEWLILENGQLFAIWMKDEKVKSYRRCSYCRHIHKSISGKLPETCPGCGMPMLKLNRQLSGIVKMKTVL